MVTRRHGRNRGRVFVGQVVVVQLGRHRLARVLAVVAMVVLVRVQVGVWPAALLGGGAGTVGVLVALAALDRRPLTGRVRQVERGARAEVVEVVEVVQVGPGRPGGGVHVEFARGLAGLAGWYLDECEREALR